MIEERPWGTFQTFHQADGWLVKQLCVRPRCRLSLQFHKRRSEHWIVLQGRGIATIGQQQRPLKQGSMLHVPVGVQHRIENVDSDVELQLIEVQMGGFLSETDIVRLADDYGRTES